MDNLKEYTGIIQSDLDFMPDQELRSFFNTAVSKGFRMEVSPSTQEMFIVRDTSAISRREAEDVTDLGFDMIVLLYPDIRKITKPTRDTLFRSDSTVFAIRYFGNMRRWTLY